MSKNEQEFKKFLEEQVNWCREQDDILVQIEMKLYEMKKLAESILINELTNAENENVNLQINKLNLEVLQLKQRLNSIVH